MSNLSIIKGLKLPIIPKLLHRIFEERAKEKPDEVALIFEGERFFKSLDDFQFSTFASSTDNDSAESRVTYGELNALANRLARQILQIVKEQKLRQKKLRFFNEYEYAVCLCMSPSINLVAMMLAIWKAGAGYLPIDVHFPENRFTHILDEAKPTLCVYDETFEHPEYFQNAEALTMKTLKETSEDLSSENVPDAESLSEGENYIGLFLYTSGSSGIAKGVRLYHSTAQERLEWQWKEFPFADDETHFAFKSPVIFVDHFAEIWSVLLAGRSLIIILKESTKNPEKLVPILEKFEVKRLTAVPSLIRGLLLYLAMAKSSEKKRKLANLRLWISSGEALTLQLAEEFFEYFDDGQHELANFYGSTEVMGDVISFSVKSFNELKGFDSFPIGRPNHNTVVYILDENKKPVNLGENGEIYVAGRFLAYGYINNSDRESFKKNHLSLVPAHSQIYKTGDHGCIKDGLIFYVGRYDTQIKIHGQRVDIAEIDNIVRRLPYLEKFSIQVWHRDEFDQAVLAFIAVKKSYAFITAKDIEADLRKKLPSNIVPQVVLLSQFPYLPSGKVDTQELLKSYQKNTEKRRESMNAVEMDLGGVSSDKVETAEKVFRIIGASLGLISGEKISPLSNFFDIGGNSLNTIRCVNQLRKENFEISITDFLKAKNLGEILDKIDHRKPLRESKIEFSVEPFMYLWAEALTDEMKSECVDILAHSFYDKGELEKFITGLKIEHFKEFLEPNFRSFVDRGLSFAVTGEGNRILAFSLNYEVGDEFLKVPESSPIETIFEYLGYVEREV